MDEICKFCNLEKNEDNEKSENVRGGVENFVSDINKLKKAKSNFFRPVII
jgi:hypothetical protein